MVIVRFLASCCIFFIMGCSSASDFAKGRTNISYYYDSWYGEVTSEIRYLGRDVVDRVRVGVPRPRYATINGFVLPDDQLPVFPDFIEIRVGELRVKLDELTPDTLRSIALYESKKSYFKSGDTSYFMLPNLEIYFVGDVPVCLNCWSENVVFVNLKTGEKSSLPMSVREMKRLFGKPDRVKKRTAL